MKNRVSVLAIAALGLLFAPVGFAQQQSYASGDSSSGAASKPAAAPAPKTSQPGKAASSSKSISSAHIKPGTDFPRWEVFAGYSFLNFRPGPIVTGTEYLNGGSASLAYNLNRWAGLVADFGGYTGNYTSNFEDPTSTIYSFLFGPRFSYRNESRWTPFAQILFGGAYGNSGVTNASATQTVFSMTVGGGLDMALTKHISWRMVQTEYMYSHFDIPSSSTSQNNIRISSGLLFRWGARPEMVNRPPVASCSADRSSVMAGSTDSVPVHASASDPDGDSLTYTWTATGGRVDGTGADARWSASGAGPGNYTITSRVDDGHGGTASCSADVAVTAPPPPPAPKPPVMSCSVDRGTVTAGERVGVTATASSPQNYTLTYAWRANGGQVVGSGSSVQFDTSGLSPGTYTITGRADDGHGQAADCSANVTVAQPPPPPQASKINECAFKPAMSARVDNVCKRVLDDVALRLQNEPKGTVVVVGYADPKSKTAAKLSTERAQNAAKYLAGKGIDSSRVTVRSGSGQEGAGAANHRIDIVWVPEGATY